MRIHWTPTARRHLRSAHDYIAQDSKRHADATVERIIRRTQHLSTFPLSGSIVSEYEDDQIREILEVPFRILYHVVDAQIDVIAVIHSARQLPQNL